MQDPSCENKDAATGHVAQVFVNSDCLAFDTAGSDRGGYILSMPAGSDDYVSKEREMSSQSPVLAR